MFVCSICKFNTEYPSLLERHINTTSHQKILKMKGNNLIFKEDKVKNNIIIEQNKKDKEQNKKDKLQEKKDKLQQQLDKLDKILLETNIKKYKLQQELNKYI